MQALDGEDRRADLGEPLRPSTTAARDARHRDLRRQALRRDERRAARGVRRAHRQDGLGHAIGDRSKGDYGTSSGPLVAKGKVIQGLGGCQRTAKRSASSAPTTPTTGKQLWRFNTVAHDGEPGGDTWGTLPNLFRAGGESWITGSYDPDLNLTYWGTAQAKPWMPVSRGMSMNDDALYTSSTLALDVDTGKLAWHFQHAPGEALDLDDRLRARARRRSAIRTCVFTIGKDGVLWKLDRKTGKYLGHKETRLPERVGRASTQDRQAARIAPTSSSRSRRVDRGSARARKAATTGRRELSPAERSS